MLIVRVSKQEAEAYPHRIWNAFVELVGTHEYEDLSGEQRPAHLVFWYESEVQNGGHLQYFENRGVERVEETIASLGKMAAFCQQQVLREAFDLLLSRQRERIRTVEEYVSAALKDDFGQLDRRFYSCSPSLQSCLEDYLAGHQSSFISLSE